MEEDADAPPPLGVSAASLDHSMRTQVGKAGKTWCTRSATLVDKCGNF